MKKIIEIKELLKLKEKNKDRTQAYIDFFTYYFTKGYKFYDNDAKMDFYIELQDVSPVDSEKVGYQLLEKIDDMCEELDCGTAEVDPDYFIEFDKKFIKLLKEYGFLKENNNKKGRL